MIDKTSVLGGRCKEHRITALCKDNLMATACKFVLRDKFMRNVVIDNNRNTTSGFLTFGKDSVVNGMISDRDIILSFEKGFLQTNSRWFMITD